MHLPASLLRALVLGGILSCASGYGSYPARGKWHPLARIPIAPRAEHTTVALSRSTIAILGGINASGDPPPTTDMMQLYDTQSNKWSYAPKIPVPLNHLNAAVVDGRIFLLGGLAVTKNESWKATPDCWVYNPRDRRPRWRPIAPMPKGTGRGTAATAVHGKTIYLAGGQTLNVPGKYQNSVTLVSAYDTVSDRWRVLPGRLPEGRDHAGAAIIGSTYYVVGGRHFGRNDVRSNVFTLDLDYPKGEWREDVARLPTARGGISTAVVGKSIYVFGGEGRPPRGDDDSGVFNQSEVLDTASGRWRSLAPMKLPRHGSSAATAGGCIYIPGGSLRQGGGPVGYVDKFCP